MTSFFLLIVLLFEIVNRLNFLMFTIFQSQTSKRKGVSASGGTPTKILKQTPISGHTAKDTSHKPKSSLTAKGSRTDDTNQTPTSSLTAKGSRIDDTNKTPKSSLTSKGSHTDDTNQTPKSSLTAKGSRIDDTNKTPKSSLTAKASRIDDINQIVKSSLTAKASRIDDINQIVKSSLTAKDTSFTSNARHASDASDTSSDEETSDAALISEIDANLILQDSQGREQEIRNLKRQLIDTMRINKVLSAQNIELQQKVVDKFPSIQCIYCIIYVHIYKILYYDIFLHFLEFWKFEGVPKNKKYNIFDQLYFAASLQTVNETSERSLQDRIASGEDLPVGTIDRISQTIHGGYGIWIPQDDYGRAKFKSKGCSTKFIRSMSRAIFTVEVLKASSVTGQLSNKDRNKVNVTPRTALNSRKVNALKAITRFWMVERKIDEDKILNAMESIGTTLSKQISDLNRKNPSRKNRTKKSKVKSKKIIPMEEEESSDGESVASENGKLKSKKTISPEDNESNSDENEEISNSRIVTQPDLQTREKSDPPESDNTTDFSEEEQLDEELSDRENFQVDTPTEDDD
ncbi:uncharacterized protein LOC127278215 isoform X1 [Leptopilina boulardi]|uniref:uncharacterized protein LOC127278215 isoform X1 n=1 Tax=Leptopilina boulardi TaxID=63433 RepID=UPI0021F5A1E5|nr:uncharacterized protein LOC127278215 isoform X1 [Leptopilina boulardi]